VGKCCRKYTHQVRITTNINYLYIIYIIYIILGVHSIFERFRGILHEGTIDKRTQYTIENLFAIRKTDFKEHPGILPELDLVADEDKITHDVYLDDKLDCNYYYIMILAQDMLDIFHLEPDYEKNDEEWNEIKVEILGDQGVPNNQNEDENMEEEEDVDGEPKVNFYY